MFPLLPILILAMVVGFEVRVEAHGLRSDGFWSDLLFSYPVVLFSCVLNSFCCRTSSEEVLLVEPGGEACTDSGRSSTFFLRAVDNCGAAGAMLLYCKPCHKSILLIGCADGHTLSFTASSFDAFKAAIQCLNNNNQFARDESKEKLKKLQALCIPSIAFLGAGMLGSDGKAMGKVLINLIKGLSTPLKVILYLHTRVGCSTCCAAPGSRFFAQFLTAMMPMRWMPSGAVGCSLLKQACKNVRLLIRFYFGSTPVLLQIQSRPRALRLVSANVLPMLRMVQISCYTLDLLQAAVDAAYSIFVPLELIRRKRVRAFPLSLLRFGGEDISVLSSVMLLFDLQLNPLPWSSHPTRLLVLRVRVLRRPLKNAIAGSSSPSSRRTAW